MLTGKQRMTLFMQIILMILNIDINMMPKKAKNRDKTKRLRINIAIICELGRRMGRNGLCLLYVNRYT